MGTTSGSSKLPYLRANSQHMQPRTYEAHVDETFHLPFDLDTLDNLDIQLIEEGRWHFIHEGRSWHVQVEETDYANKYFVLRIDGFRHRVRLSDPYDVLVDRLGLAKSATSLANHIAAPMPGLVRDILVAGGDHVYAGSPLLILEAMKMENVIKSPGEGMVDTLLVQSGQSVEKGQVLITFKTV